MRQVAGSGIVQRFLAFLHANDLIGDTIGIAFSGGPDSSALAVAAAEAARANLIRPFAIHIDHGVRADSATDLPTIQDTCSRLDLELVSIKANLGPKASEVIMRVERYRLLAAIVHESGGRAAMTGHHAGDQAETVLLHMIRGSGLEGIAAMAPVERWTKDDEATPLDVIRPFLLESRESLFDLVIAAGVSYLVDPTNADRDKARNAVRLDVMPTLERIHPGATAALARLAGIARAEEEALHELALQRSGAQTEGDTLAVDEIRNEPIAIQRRIIRNWVKSHTRLDLSWNRTEAVRSVISSDRGGTMIELGERWSACREGNTIRLTKPGGAVEG